MNHHQAKNEIKQIEAKVFIAPLTKVTKSMRFSFSIILLLLGAKTASGFHCLPELRTKNAASSLTIKASEASSDTKTVERESVGPSKEELLISSVLDRLPTALSVSNQDQRTSINEALLKLEQLNPTENPATSPLLNGVWELRYAGGYTSEGAINSPTRQLALFLYSGGYSPGIFALSLAQQLPSNLVKVDDLEISVSRDQPRVEARVKVGFFGQTPQQDIVVRCELMAQSGVRLQEVYESAEVLGQPISIPTQMKYRRDLYVTYVDNDLLIIRDDSGVPEVLVRKEKVFLDNWGTEPGDVDDMMPPGSS